MSKSNNLTDFLVDIAGTIRAEKGTTDPINPQNFSTEIGNIADKKHTEGYNEGVNYQKSLLTSLNVTENGTYTNENGYNEVNVNVAGGGKVVLKNGTKLSRSTFTTVSDYYDFREITDFSFFFYSNINLEEVILDSSYTGSTEYMFADNSVLVSVTLSNIRSTNTAGMFSKCQKLQSVPLFDTSNCESFAETFSSCNMLQTIPQFDTSKATNMRYMFYNCYYALTTIPQLNTSNVTDMTSMFELCRSLTSIPLLDTSKVKRMNHMFSNCNSLESLPEFNCPNVTDIGNYFRVTMSSLITVGGWKNLKCNWNDNYGLYVCPNLTYESCINILNGLYDFTGNGETPTSSQGNLKVNQNFLNLVGNEISIGTNKGWTITS